MTRTILGYSLRHSTYGSGAVILKRLLIILTSVCIFGCDPSPVEEDLSFAALDSTQLEIDVTCVGECQSDSTVPFVVDYEQRGQDPSATVEFKQYRVDYKLDGVKGPVPYFADKIQDGEVGPGGSLPLLLTMVGSTQRKYVATHAQKGEASGTATVTLAGYDFLDSQVFITAVMKIHFVQGTVYGQ